MNAFERLDHLLCQVPDIEQAFDLLHRKLGFPVAWPIGTYWPNGKQCGIALGGINLELIQSFESPVKEASIRCIAFEPTADIHQVLDREKIPYNVFIKKESTPELLEMRGLPAAGGEQVLCTNTMIDESRIAFSFFACEYAPRVKKLLAPESFEIPGGNSVEEILIGHREPQGLKEDLQRLGVHSGVRLTAHKHSSEEVTAIVMKNGPLDLGNFPSRFKFIASAR